MLYVGMGLGWLDGMVIIGQRYFESNFCANKNQPSFIHRKNKSHSIGTKGRI